MKKLFVIREEGNESLVASLNLFPKDDLIETLVDYYVNYYIVNVVGWKLKDGKRVVKQRIY